MRRELSKEQLGKLINCMKKTGSNTID